MKNLLKELNQFDHESFNWHYRTLVDVAISATREDEVLQTLSFLDSLQTFIEKVNESLKNIPGETHCPMCEAKEKTIQTADHLMEQAQKFIKEKNDTINTLREQLREALEKLNSVNEKQLKVCGK